MQSHEKSFCLQEFCHYRYEPPHGKTNKMTVHPAKTQISLGIRPVWSEPSLCTHWVAKDPLLLQADSKDSDQTGQMPRLIWVFTGRTVSLLVLSRDGSYISTSQYFIEAILKFHFSEYVVETFDKNSSLKTNNEPPHDKTNKWPVHTQRRLRSAWASAQSDQSSLCTWWVAKDPRFLHTGGEDSAETGRMHRLIWVFAGCMGHFAGFVMLQIKSDREQIIIVGAVPSRSVYRLH